MTSEQWRDPLMQGDRGKRAPDAAPTEADLQRARRVARVIDHLDPPTMRGERRIDRRGQGVSGFNERWLELDPVGTGLTKRSLDR